MPPQRGTETSQLANVIEVIQLGRKTGVLTVERSTDSSFETGEITFSNGQITQAHGERGLNGQQALFWFKKWGPCRFVFTTAQGIEKNTQPLPAVRKPKLLNDTAQGQHLHDTQDTLNVHVVPMPRQMSPSPQEPVHTVLHAIPKRMQEGEQALRHIENAGLSRSHRQLFLLVDGTRTVTELLRLTGRKQDEIFRLLRDLAYIGVIR